MHDIEFRGRYRLAGRTRGEECEQGLELIGTDGAGHGRGAQIVARISHGVSLQCAIPGADDSYVASGGEDVQDVRRLYPPSSRRRRTGRNARQAAQIVNGRRGFEAARIISLRSVALKPIAGHIGADVGRGAARGQSMRLSTRLTVAMVALVLLATTAVG